MRLLVTGAGGMLGRDVVRAAEEADHRTSALSRADLDVTEAGTVARVIGDERPDAIVNCAAWTDVDAAEEHEEEAWAVNAQAPGHLARAASEVGAVLVHVSTDYVFDGTAGRPYRESDAPGPLSAYGRSKLAGEQAVSAAGGAHVIARSAWLFGTGGANFVEAVLARASAGEELRVVTDQVGSPTWTGHLAHALLRLAVADAPGLHHAAAAGACSRFDLACEALRQAGSTAVVVPEESAAMARPAPRPPFSALLSERSDTPALPPWQEGVAGFLAERAARRGSEVAT